MIENSSENIDILPTPEANAPGSAGVGIRQAVLAQSGWWKRISIVLLVAGIGWLAWFSFYLAGMRIYQVDECLNVFRAFRMATHQPVPGPDLFQIILTWVLPIGSRATNLFATARLVSWLIFWLNLILLAMATGERIFSRRWLIALAGAVTLAPLWDFGFEARHDNLLLTGILLMWGVVRFQPPKMGAFFFVGACFVGLEFVSNKAVMYTFPISLGIFVFPPPGERKARWKLFAAWCLGAALAFVAMRLVFKLAGLDYLSNVKGAAAAGQSGQLLRFWPFDLTLSPLLVRTPLLVAMTLAAFIACGATLFRDRRAALNWDGILPEALLCADALLALFVNPNPYPYNLLHVVPYAFLLAYRYGATLWKQLPERSVLAPLALSAIAFTHLVPFATATNRHASRPNFRQEELMNLTEDITDPEKDCVFDGIGLVPTRKVCDMRASIHGQDLKRLVDGSGPHIRDMLAANPPSVIILSYRTDWLPPEDHDFFNQRYVPLSDDFMVLGKLLPSGGGTFEVYHAGRYRITSAEGSNIAGTYPPPATAREAIATPKQVPPLVGTVDGVSLNGQPVELSVGTHRIDCGADLKPAVVWVGPHLNELPRAPGGSRHLLFVNWY
jgi:hypothetical protein